MKHMLKQIETLKKKTLSLAAIVEECVAKAVRAIEKRDKKLAQEVLESGVVIDQMEVDVEEECLMILALYQPVAIDLRFVVAVFKLNTDLERISDLADNIAERAIFLAYQEEYEIPFDFKSMTEKTISMLKKSLDSLVNMDVKLAYTVIAMDDEVDAINRDMYIRVHEGIQNNPNSSEILIHLLCVSRHLERIADHATNIAEDVIYMIEGEIIRHKTENYIVK
jgi:phosphate transport system protein